MPKPLFRRHRPHLRRRLPRRQPRQKSIVGANIALGADFRVNDRPRRANAGIDDLSGLLTLAIDPVGQLTAMGEGLASLVQWAAADPGGAAQTLLRQVMTACSESPGGCVGTGAYWVATTIGSGGITTLGSASKLGKLLASQSGRIVEESAKAAEGTGMFAGLRGLMSGLPPESYAAAMEKSGVTPAALGVGYFVFYLYTTVVGIAGMLLVFYVAARQPKPETVADEAGR